jgi:hypothetical protein
MKLVGDMGHVGSCFGPFRDSVIVSVSEINVLGLRQTYQRLWSHFGRTQCTPR